MMDVGADMIGMVKTKTKRFCKETIDNMKKYWTGGSYLVLKRKYVLPGDRSLIAIGYEYNVRKVLYFIAA